MTPAEYKDRLYTLYNVYKNDAENADEETLDYAYSLGKASAYFHAISMLEQGTENL